MIVIKQWLLSKNNNKKYKKQQFIKALKHSYINRKRKKLIINKFKNINLINNNIVLKFKLLNNIYYNTNFNWLLKK